jgi:predicted MFS family arabinose efflux permease
MKRSLSFGSARGLLLVVAGTGLIAGTYGLVRLAYGLFLPDISASVAMGTAVAGYIGSGASVAYCLGALAGLGAHRRPRVLVVSAIVTASGGAVVMALAPTLAVLAPAVVVASAGAGLASPGLVAVVGRNIAAPLTASAQATVNAGTGPGLVAAGLLALLLPDWRAAFVASAVVTALAGAGVLLLDRHDVRYDDDLPASHAGPDLRPTALALAVPGLASLLLGVASAATWTYGRTQVAAAGASATESVLAWIALGVGGTATVLTARHLAGTTPQRAWLLSVGVVAASTACLALAAGPLLVHVLACAGFGWGFVAASSALIVWAGNVAPGRDAAGTSLLFIALVLGQSVGSAVAGTLADVVGMSTTFGLAALVALVAAACARLPGSAPSDEHSLNSPAGVSPTR